MNMKYSKQGKQYSHGYHIIFVRNLKYQKLSLIYLKSRRIKILRYCSIVRSYRPEGNEEINGLDYCFLLFFLPSDSHGFLFDSSFGL